MFCKEENGDDSVYIGEAENIKNRLVQHIGDYKLEKKSYYWNMAVIFTGRDLNKALIRYLEYRLVEMARAAGRYNVLTQNTYKNTVIKESQVSAMEEFLSNIQVLINALGYKVLEPLNQQNQSISENSILYLSTNAGQGQGRVTADGFLLFKGANISSQVSPSVSRGLIQFRQENIDKGKVKDFITTEDILFSSPSAAAAFITGYSISGPQNWKTKKGKMLKDL